MKSRDQLGYEAYCKRFPTYGNGEKRPPWKEFKKTISRIDRETKARCNAKGSFPYLRELEAEYLKEHPHLADQRWCGLAPDTEDRPRHRVECPNGHVFYSAWYKIPKTDADAKQAFKEQKWLSSEEGRKWYAETFKPSFITQIADAIAA